ncbi:YlzJ-like family protein [Aquibacillus sp. 3ASR75-11]|uniref:YlzJ-like family protein n=1 Tax=Terrihalobacillus insolitus TaxID=2950438 RepID=A0A9X3WQR0_9BACI|nr:YlzJ-like family protein [Terrihalobacillus insolitus]MDC3414084.1 YlzJ-like family protein [Terrihalobacillus insolitus]MDC3423525.1 YlzJ-like family protein [Terrihalobacillus insolitus]
MILYTPLSEHDIFPEDQSKYSNLELISVNGVSVQATRLKNGSYRIVQVLSTNPQDFMKSDLAPGTIIS